MAAASHTGNSLWNQQIEETGRLIEKMKLQEDEEDDLEWEEVLDMEEIKPKWLVIGRLLMRKSFSQSALIADMMASWNLAQIVVSRRIKANLFTIQLNCLGD
ncbi:hypothetical protein D1007_17956 [Hordeum vulgare]|nr:hypothetical protein D1007_17956 [Hordeum vulgare]